MGRFIGAVTSGCLGFFIAGLLIGVLGIALLTVAPFNIILIYLVIFCWAFTSLLGGLSAMITRFRAGGRH